MQSNDTQKLRAYIDNWSTKKRTNISFDSFVNEINTVKHLIGKKNISSVVEIGSGSGLFLIAGTALGFFKRAVGVEPSIDEAGTSAGEFRDAKGYVSSLGLDDNLSFISGTLEGFLEEHRDKTYEMFLFRQTLHHIFNKTAEENEVCIQALSVLHSLLSDNGHICILEASEQSSIHKAFYSLYRSIRGIGQIKWLDKRDSSEWVEILQKAGYKNIQSEKMPINLFSSVKILQPIRTFLSCTFVIVAKK